MQFKDYNLSLTYQDIGIVPVDFSTIRSRGEVYPSTALNGAHSSLPIIVAPMETVVGCNMIRAIFGVGGLVVLPRLKTIDATAVLISQAMQLHRDSFWVSIPAKDTFPWIKMLRDMNVTKINIDVANGFHILVAETIEIVKRYIPKAKIMIGNVGSYQGYKQMAAYGVDAIRVGIGGGGVCTTSIQTGIGVGQASLVRDIATRRRTLPENKRPALIADGGIKCPGDVVKAIALGADIAMMGSVFAGTEESPGATIMVDGKPYKQLAGQASFQVKRNNNNVEGASKLVPLVGSLSQVWKNYEDGIRSGLAYTDCVRTNELRYLPDDSFTNLSPSARHERTPHA